MKKHIPNIARILILVVVDAFVLVCTGLWAIFITIGQSASFSNYLSLLFIVILLKLIAAYCCKVYDISLRYCSLDLLEHSLSLIAVDVVLFLFQGFRDGFYTIPTRMTANIAMELTLYCWERERSR